MTPLKLLIVAATKKEIEPLLAVAEATLVENHGYLQVIINNLPVDVVITGVGMVPTAYWVTKRLTISTYDFAINVGICGSYNKNVPLGQVFHVTEDSFPEIGAEVKDGFLSSSDMQLTDPDEYPFRNGILFNRVAGKNRIIDALPLASSVTVNTIRGEEKSISLFWQRAKSDLETMEGAAFFFACMMQGVTCFQIRAVSNYIENRDIASWDIPLAVNNLNNTLVKIITSWNEVSS